MAELHDDKEKTSESIETEELDADSKQKESEGADQQQTAKQDDEIPERYRGKSIKELVDIAEHANKSMGRYSNELGEVRRLADELIKSQLQMKPKETEDQPKVDIFENPEEAMRIAVESNPKVRAAEHYAVQALRVQARQLIEKLHPDIATVSTSEEFVNWVKGSRVRMELAAKADAYDVDAANELLTTFKELRSAKVAREQVEDKTARTKAIASAATETGGSGEGSKKIYRRADLMNMRLYHPAKFAAIKEDVERAYQEGRVK